MIMMRYIELLCYISLKIVSIENKRWMAFKKSDLKQKNLMISLVYIIKCRK